MATVLDEQTTLTWAHGKWYFIFKFYKWLARFITVEKI